MIHAYAAKTAGGTLEPFGKVGPLFKTTARMLDFAARHGIEPVTETFAFSQMNEAMAHFAEGKARYRIVLKH